MQQFTKGTEYNYAIFDCDENGISFDRGMRHEEAKFKDRGFKKNVIKILEKLRITEEMKDNAINGCHLNAF